MRAAGKVADKIDMKERILQTADRLFYLQGIRAIGVDTIAAAVQASDMPISTPAPSMVLRKPCAVAISTRPTI